MNGLIYASVFRECSHEVEYLYGKAIPMLINHDLSKNLRRENAPENDDINKND